MSQVLRRRMRRMLADPSLVRLAALAALAFVVFALLSPAFFSVINFQSMGFQVAEVGLLSLAVMLSMLTGGIDLSIVSIAAVASVVAAKLFTAVDAASMTGVGALAATAAFIVVGMLAGVACGVLNGTLITRLRISPILATLGTMQLLNGVAVILTGGRAIYGFPSQFLTIGNGHLAGVPVPLLILLAGATLTTVFVNRTGVGLSIKLVGANPIAARYSGLNNDRVLMLTYVASAILASSAGIIIAARSASANADYGASYVLLAIVIVVLGGVNPLGGYGTVTGVVLAAFTLQMVSSGFNQIGLTAFHYLVAQGVILITVIGIDTLSGRFYISRWIASMSPRRSRGRCDPGEGQHQATSQPSGGGPTEPGSERQQQGGGRT